MATQTYDCFFLFDSNRYNRDPGGVAASVQASVEKFGGEILASRLWDERRLAYPIDGHTKGTYWITYFKMDSLQLKDFNRDCQLNENIMRFLVTRVDPRLVETLVAHALGKPSSLAPRAEDADAVGVAVGDEVDGEEEFDAEEE
ncbi:MAG: 30S ribosomal protein S6 [Pirellulales bacterium]